MELERREEEEKSVHYILMLSAVSLLRIHFYSFQYRHFLIVIGELQFNFLLIYKFDQLFNIIGIRSKLWVVAGEKTQFRFRESCHGLGK